MAPFLSFWEKFLKNFKIEILYLYKIRKKKKNSFFSGHGIKMAPFLSFWEKFLKNFKMEILYFYKISKKTINYLVME